MEDLLVSKVLNIHSKIHDYKVRFEPDFKKILLTEHYKKGDILLVDANVRNIFATEIDSILDNRKHIIISPSEEHKSYEGLVPILTNIIESGFKKNNRLIAIGGGIIQDITAFSASILYRGVDWIFYPTTLLAQCDSCIGSKTSINFGKYKNQVGGFYPPIDIVIDIRFLNTLTNLDFRSGMGEMLHYYFISGKNDFERIVHEYELAFTDSKVLQSLIYHSLDFKRGYVERDEYDKGPRNIFNYGHTFGHAIESITDFRIPHGISVSFGMDIANYISLKSGYITKLQYFEMRKILEINWRNIKLEGINIKKFVETLKMDKKSIDGEIRVILTKGLGEMFKTALAIDDEVSGWLQDCFSKYH